jgi:hypothetical protein
MRTYTDVEFGVGEVSSDNPVWAFSRNWDGLTFLSYDVTTYVFDGPTGTSCDRLSGGQINASLGASWLDRPPATASFLTAEFGYAIMAGRAEAWLRSSRGAFFQYAAPAGCALPAALPVLIVLDHLADASSPTQRVDYVYVRPTAAIEPTATTLTNSTLPCGAPP